MSLAGLLSILDEDPQLRDVLARPGSPADPDEGQQAPASHGLVAPPSLRPFLAAALAAFGDDGADVGDDGAGARPPAVRPAARTARLRAGEPLSWRSPPPRGRRRIWPPRWGRSCRQRRWRTSPAGRPCRTNACRRGRTRWAARIAILRRLAHPEGGDQDPAGALAVVVAPIRSVLQPIVAGLGDLEPVRLHVGDSYDLDELLTRLVEIGYARADLVGNRGEIAVRGGIVDVFPPTEEHPLRVEFFGDTVEDIRYFKVADQRSIETAGHGLWAPPCRELLLTPTVRERAKILADTHPALTEVLSKLADGITVEGMEAFAPVLADRMELLVDYIPSAGTVLACDPERIRARADELVRTSREFLEASWINAAAGGQAPIDLGAAAFQPIGTVREAAAAHGVPWWTISPFGVAESPSQDADPGHDAGQALSRDWAFRINALLTPAYRGDTARMMADVRGWLAESWRVVLVTEGHGPAQRLAEMLRGEGIGARLDDLDGTLEAGVPYVTTARLENGFTWPAIKLAVLTEADLAGHSAGLATTKDMRRMPSRRGGGVDPLQLKTGDYVVHEQHGVGRYIEMTSRTAAGATREYLVIEYAPARRGSRRTGCTCRRTSWTRSPGTSGGEAPALHRLGGADWAKAKGRARKAVRQIASELIRLYSARMAAPGYAFGQDTPWQRELEDAFPYVETPDQLGAIDEVKRDMERPVPMDRLICGDVGYGKTEIAVRAAFKAVQDGKQVAVLVPTTLLVQQHSSTFTERYAPFPVKVRPLSRFQTAAESDADAGGPRGRQRRRGDRDRTSCSLPRPGSPGWAW